MTEALVTGATGFVGNNLTRKLLERGYSVTCLVRNSHKAQNLADLPVRLAVADLENSAGIKDAVQGIDLIFHAAGAIKAANREHYFAVNCLGTRRLLEAVAEENPGIKRFVHISSLSAAGPSLNAEGISEEDKPNPISWYGESKRASEEEVLRFAEKFPVTILRPSAVYGPRDPETLMIYQMVKRGCLFTPGRRVRRFSIVHVDDLNDAILLAGQSDLNTGETFFISNTAPSTWDQFGRLIAKSMAKPFRQIAFPECIARAAGYAGDLYAKASGKAATVSSQKIRELLQANWICNPAKAIKLLGFDAKIELEKGINETIEWYQLHNWL
jgi:nucleoside-diphosphate-sugar epimerase